MTKEACIREVADLTQINRCREELSEVNNSIIMLAEIMKLVGNDVRLKILFLLSKEDKLCPCDLSDILDMSVPAISQHLRKMKDKNLVETTREGQIIFYSLTSKMRTILQSEFDYITENKILDEVAA